MFLHVGSGYWTDEDGAISTYELDLDRASAAPVHAVACPRHPTHLAASPDGHAVYANIERPEAALAAFSWDGSRLEPLAVIGSGERGAAYVGSYDGFIGQVNYGSHSVTLFRADAAGGPGDVAARVAFDDESYPHSICFHPDGPWVYVAGRSAETIWRFDLDPAGGRLVPGPACTVPPEVSGPRHLVLHPDRTTLYCSDERSSTASGYRVEPDGGLTHLQTVSTLPGDGPAGNAPADIAVHPGGRAAYVVNRADRSIAVFSIGADRLLRPAGHLPTGRGPRNLAIDPDGSVLAAGNMEDGFVQTHRLDPLTGLPCGAGPRIAVRTPSGVLFSRKV